MNPIEVTIPDIGDFKDVEIIEILVKEGDVIKPEQSLVTVESDKATIEIPSSHGGKVKELKVKTGDKVSQGSLLLLLEPKNAAMTTAVAAPAATSTPAVNVSTTKADLECDVMVLGAGPGGYSAAFRAADLGMKTVLVEHAPTLGGVCLNVGCIPSKALLHVAAVIEEANRIAEYGVTFAQPTIDIDQLRSHKDQVITKMTEGLASMAKMRKVQIIRGTGQFLDAHHIEVTTADHNKQLIQFKKAIIAAGSSSVMNLPFLQGQKDERIVDSTGALALPYVPKRMLVIGGGIIGLEMATVYSTLGACVDVVEIADGLMLGADRDLVKIWQKHNEKRLGCIMLKTKVAAIEILPQGIQVSFAGKDAAITKPQLYDLVLIAAGRSPNGHQIAAHKAGVIITERGFIPVDQQMRTNVSHIFAVGDIVGPPMLAHKAVHEGHVAAEVAAGKNAVFDVKVIPSVAYTDPEIAWVGLTEDEAMAKHIQYKSSTFPWTASGRAVAQARQEGMVKLLFDVQTARIVGGAIIGVHAGDMIGEIALAIEMGADAIDIGKTIHPHPTFGETIGMAAELFAGICTDLPPMKS